MRRRGGGGERHRLAAGVLHLRHAAERGDVRAGRQAAGVQQAGDRRGIGDFGIGIEQPDVERRAVDQCGLFGGV